MRRGRWTHKHCGAAGEIDSSWSSSLNMYNFYLSSDCLPTFRLFNLRFYHFKLIYLRINPRLAAKSEIYDENQILVDRGSETRGSWKKEMEINLIIFLVNLVMNLAPSQLTFLYHCMRSRAILMRSTHTDRLKGLFQRADIRSCLSACSQLVDKITCC